MPLSVPSAGSSVVPTAAKTGAYTASAGDAVPVDASGGAVTITLPAGAAAGSVVEVKKTDASANAVTVVPSGSDTIDGRTTVAITAPSHGRTYRKDTGTNWLVTDGLTPIAGPGSVRYDRARNIYLPSDTCLLNFKKAAARARNGGAAARVLGRGDSTTLGVLSGNNPGSIAAQKYPWMPRARQLLQASGQIGGAVVESAHDLRSTSDARLTIGTGWTGSEGAIAASTATGTFTFADDSQSNAFDLVIQRQSGVPTTVPVSIDGGATQNIDISSLTVSRQAATFRVAVSGGAVTTHTLVISAPNAGSISVLAIEPVNTNSPPVLKLGQFGVSGQQIGTAGLNPAVTTAGSNMESFLKAAPDLAVLLMGINDMHFWTSGNGTPAQGAAAYRTALDAYVTAMRAISCDPVFIVFPSYNYASQSPGVYEQLLWHQQIFDSAEANDVAVIDLQRRWGFGTAPTTGFATTPASASALYDGVHPTLLGYWDIGRMVANFLASVI